MCPVPDSAPPYDSDLVPPNDGEAEAAGQCGGAGGGMGGSSARPSRGPARRPPGERAASGALGESTAAVSPGWGDGPPGGPGRFAQVLAETLAGARPPRQLVPWTTERARSRIQRLGPLLTGGQQPRLRRVMMSQPAPDVIEMAMVVGFGPRFRAVAIRLERATCQPSPARARPAARQTRWVCTEVEAA